MRSAHLLLFILFSLTIFSQAPKGANVIVVKNIGYDELLNALLDKGYFIDKKDTVLKIASTERKQLSKQDPSSNYLIRVRVKDSTAYISGEVNIVYFTNTFKDEKYVPAEISQFKWSPERQVFDKMEEFAKGLQKEIAYLQ